MHRLQTMWINGKLMQMFNTSLAKNFIQTVSLNYFETNAFLEWNTFHFNDYKYQTSVQCLRNFEHL